MITFCMFVFDKFFVLYDLDEKFSCFRHFPKFLNFHERAIDII